MGHLKKVNYLSLSLLFTIQGGIMVRYGKIVTASGGEVLFEIAGFTAGRVAKDKLTSNLEKSIDWMRARVLAIDVAGMIHDYDFLSSQLDILEVHEAIRLSAHAISRDPNQIPGQFMGRLKDKDSVEIQSSLDKMPRKVHDPWIRPLSQSLTSLEGH